MSLDIQWPKVNKNGKWLLYLVKVSGEGIQEVSCSPAQEISPLKQIKVSQTLTADYENILTKTSSLIY